MPSTTRPGLLVVLVACLVAAGTILAARPSRAAKTGPTKVKLYEGGKVVGEWTAESAVRNEGDVLVFTVRKGVTSYEVRVQGTYSAEQTD